MDEPTITQPITAEIYYTTCGQIDRHNRCYQEILDIYICLGTTNSSKRFNLSIFAMNVVDVWLAYQGITRMADIQADFYNYLAEEIIYNTYDRFMLRCAEGRSRKFFDSDDDYIDDENPRFGWIKWCSQV